MLKYAITSFTILSISITTIFAQHRGSYVGEYIQVSPGNADMSMVPYYNFTAIAKKENDSNYTKYYPTWDPDGRGVRGFGSITLNNTSINPCTVYVYCGEDNNPPMADSRLYASNGMSNWISLDDDHGYNATFAARIILGGWSTAYLRASMYGDERHYRCDTPWYGVIISSQPIQTDDGTYPTMYTYNNQDPVFVGNN